MLRRTISHREVIHVGSYCPFFHRSPAGSFRAVQFIVRSRDPRHRGTLDRHPRSNSRPAGSLSLDQWRIHFPHHRRRRNLEWSTCQRERRTCRRQRSFAERVLGCRRKGHNLSHDRWHHLEKGPCPFPGRSHSRFGQGRLFRHAYCRRRQEILHHEQRQILATRPIISRFLRPASRALRYSLGVLLFHRCRLLSATHPVDHRQHLVGSRRRVASHVVVIHLYNQTPAVHCKFRKALGPALVVLNRPLLRRGSRHSCRTGSRQSRYLL